MDRNDILAKSLVAFLQYGYRKASMEDIARIAGISRQGLYTHFTSKAELIDKSQEYALSETVRCVGEALKSAGQLSERLLRAFDACGGAHVDALRSSPHASEVLVVTNEELMAETSQEIRRLFAEALRPVAGRAARDVALVLTAASKGFMYTAADRSSYYEGMTTVVRVVLAGLPKQEPRNRKDNT
jgi:AcrR family transcriptional regulator